MVYEQSCFLSFSTLSEIDQALAFLRLVSVEFLKQGDLF